MLLRLSTRGSRLALWQAEHVAALLTRSDPDLTIELVVVATHGDRRQDIPIWELGGKGVFVKEVQAAVLDGRADMAVHSAKDLPSITPAELVIAAVPERGDPRDALVGATLESLPPGGQVATGSVRRRAQLAALRPDLTFSGLRGNIATRLGQAQQHDAIVVAVAALERLELADRIGQRLPTDVLVPQVGQGALAVECRGRDSDVIELLASIEHEPSRRAVDAERAFLLTLGGDCDLPAGAHAVVAEDGHLQVSGVLASLDGHIVLRHRVRGDAPADLGTELAEHLLSNGGQGLLGR